MDVRRRIREKAEHELGEMALIVLAVLGLLSIAAGVQLWHLVFG